MQKKLIGIGAIVLVLALLLTLAPSCGNGDEKATPTPQTGVTPTPWVTPTPTGEVKTLKIGALCALSGPAAAWGAAHELGMKIAMEDINDAGGIKVGPDTYMIEIISCDTKYVASVAVDCALRMIHDEGCKFTIGGIGTILATRGIFNDAKVINIGLGTTPPEPDLYYWINGNVATDFWVESCVKQAYEAHPEVKTLAIINPNTEGSRDWADAHHVAAAKYGQTIVASEFVEWGTVDFYPVLTKILAKKPDAIALDSNTAGASLLITKQARELGYTGWIQHPSPVPLVLLKEGMPNEYLYNIATNEEIFSQPVFTQSVRELNERVVTQYNKPGEPMNCCTVHGYSHVEAIVTAIEQAGSIDVDDVMKVFDDPDFRFNRVYVENAKVGGFETYGIRRQFPHFQAYSEIHDGGVITSSKANIVECP